MKYIAYTEKDTYGNIKWRWLDDWNELVNEGYTTDHYTEEELEVKCREFSHDANIYANDCLFVSLDKQIAELKKRYSKINSRKYVIEIFSEFEKINEKIRQDEKNDDIIEEIEELVANIKNDIDGEESEKAESEEYGFLSDIYDYLRDALKHREFVPQYKVEEADEEEIQRFKELTE